jgi:hypothetical protein
VDQEGQEQEQGLRFHNGIDPTRSGADLLDGFYSELLQWSEDLILIDSRRAVGAALSSGKNLLQRASQIQDGARLAQENIDV